jgi:hypothetical protein
MPAISWDEPVANQRDLFRDDRPCRLDPFERIVPVDAEEVCSGKDRIGLLINKISSTSLQRGHLVNTTGSRIGGTSLATLILLSDHRSLKPPSKHEQRMDYYAEL